MDKSRSNQLKTVENSLFLVFLLTLCSLEMYMMAWNIHRFQHRPTLKHFREVTGIKWGLEGFFTPPPPLKSPLKQKQDNFSCFELIWPCCNHKMTLSRPWDNNNMKYNHILRCLLRLGLIRCNLCISHWSKYNISVLFRPFLPIIRQYWYKDDLKGRGWKHPPTLVLSL